jgi:DNA-binding transcriptional LysR family regulator
MELRHLRYFVAVAEEHSFSRAAQVLHVSQSAISEQISDLEAEMGVRLLERSPRTTTLTEPGKMFLARSRRILEESHNAVMEAQRTERGDLGVLRIGFFAGGVGDGFPELVRGFRKLHPLVELSLHEMISAEQWTALAEGRIDIGFTRAPEPQFRRDIRYESVQSDPIVAVLPSTHRKAAAKRIDLKELTNDPFVLSSRSVSPSVFDKVIELCTEAGFSPKIASLSTVWSSVILMVRSGEGVSLLPINQQQGATTDVAFVPLKNANASVELCVCWSARRDRQLLRSFRELVRSHVRSNRRL